MMVLWEERIITMHELGKRLYLDSGTLTPVLKKLESMGYIKRRRKEDDERVVVAEITKEGEALRGDLFTPKEAAALKKQLYHLLHALA